MGSQLRIYRRRIRSVQSTKKITRAMELIAASRIVKAQQRVAASKPYADEITRVLSALASSTNTDHPLLVERDQPREAGVLVVTSDRGLAGAYNANVLRTAEELMALLRNEGKKPVLYVIGRKGVAYYRFRQREPAREWTGFSEQPRYQNAREVGQALVQAFRRGRFDEEVGTEVGTEVGPEVGRESAPAGQPAPQAAEEGPGVDEVHVVYTEYRTALVQAPVARRVTPLVVEERPETEAPEGYLPEYEFEPNPDELLDALLPKYVYTRIYAALLESAASESASRRRAMKAATDNAEELIRTYTREANQARQAEITQEISEIVGGADALAAARAESDRS